MPTQEQLDQRTAEIEREYPESLPDRFQWWARVLDIDRVRLFRLLGLSGSEATRTPLTALPRVVEAQVDRAEMVDDMLGQLLASFDYDLPALRAALHEPLGTPSEEKRPGKRRSGEDVPLPYTPSPQVRRGMLLNQIVAGGPFALRTPGVPGRADDDRQRPPEKADGLTPVPASTTGRSMFHTPAAGTLYYRVTRKKTRPSGVLTGMGSYYSLGGVTTGPISGLFMRPTTPWWRSLRWPTTRPWNGRSGSAAGGWEPRCPCRG